MTKQILARIYTANMSSRMFNSTQDWDAYSGAKALLDADKLGPW